MMIYKAIEEPKRSLQLSLLLRASVSTSGSGRMRAAMRPIQKMPKQIPELQAKPYFWMTSLGIVSFTTFYSIIFKDPAATELKSLPAKIIPKLK